MTTGVKPVSAIERTTTAQLAPPTADVVATKVTQVVVLHSPLRHHRANQRSATS
jgi:hypothetical protein